MPQRNSHTASAEVNRAPEQNTIASYNLLDRTHRDLRTLFGRPCFPALLNTIIHNTPFMGGACKRPGSCPAVGLTSCVRTPGICCAGVFAVLAVVSRHAAHAPITLEYSHSQLSTHCTHTYSHAHRDTFMGSSACPSNTPTRTAARRAVCRRDGMRLRGQAAPATACPGGGAAAQSGAAARRGARCRGVQPHLRDPPPAPSAKVRH